MRATILVLVMACGGCLTTKLRTPVEDHFVQSQTIANRCRDGGYPEAPCSKDLQEDLDAMADQAELLDNIVKGQKPAEVSDGGE